MEKTLIILKPDCMERRLCGTVLARFEAAVKNVLAKGLRTADIYEAGTTKVSTTEMGDAVVAAL